MVRGRGIRTEAVLSVLLVGAVPFFSAVARAGDKDKDKNPVTAKTAFAKLKTLAGTWNNKVSNTEHLQDGAHNKVVYRLTGAGSALVETDFPESNQEMVSVYHLDGDDLRLTHYCSAGNQPRLKLDRASSTPTRYVFVFDGGTNMDPAKDLHIHGMTLSFEKDEVEAAWEAHNEGKSAGVTRFHLTRTHP
jgi:hypothetical protein